MSVEVVPEAGITHGGNLKVAQQLADSALLAGCGCVKFQTYLPDKVLRKNDPARPILEKVALSFKDTVKLAKHCEDIGIEFMSTPGDLDSLKFLIEECGVKRIKIGSDDLTYKLLIEAAFASRKNVILKNVILSTGMATIGEIQEALPYAGWDDVTLLHCVSLYPCPTHKANLRSITALKQLERFPVGYSDHCIGFMASYLAVALGAVMIEKHFCPNGYDGPDKEVSLIPVELGWFVNGIREQEKTLGTGIKEPCAEELAVVKSLRKGSDGLRGQNG